MRFCQLYRQLQALWTPCHESLTYCFSSRVSGSPPPAAAPASSAKVPLLFLLRIEFLDPPLRVLRKRVAAAGAAHVIGDALVRHLHRAETPGHNAHRLIAPLLDDLAVLLGLHLVFRDEQLRTFPGAGVAVIEED